MDGARISYAAAGGGGVMDIYQKAANGAAEETLLYKSGEHKWPTSLSRDECYLFYTANGGKSKTDLWVLSLEGERKARVFLNTEFNERDGQFSPDTHWVAYESDESGNSEIYVRPFPDPSTAKLLVSKGGGTNPRWRDDGKEIFYLAPDQSVMAVDVTSSPSFQPGVPKALFKVEGAEGFAVFADARKFMVGVPTADSLAVPFTVMVNWHAALKK